jgi:hypothetical protein
MHLRLRDRSVDDLKRKYSGYNSLPPPRGQSVPKDTYRPLWRSASVQNIAQRFNSIERQNAAQFQQQQLRKPSPSPTRRNWSLSTEQISSLKGQLDGILAKTNKGKVKEEKCNTLPLPKRAAAKQSVEDGGQKFEENPAFASMTSPRTMSSMTLSEDQASNADRSSFLLVLNPPKKPGLYESTDSSKSVDTVVKGGFDSRVKFFEEKGLIASAADKPEEKGLHTVGLEQDTPKTNAMDALNIDVGGVDDKKPPIEMRRHYVPERTVSSLDLSSTNQHAKPFAMYNKANQVAGSASVVGHAEQRRPHSLDREQTKYNRSYLAMVKAGDVLRLRHKLEAREMVERQARRETEAKVRKTQSLSPRREDKTRTPSPGLVKPQTTEVNQDMPIVLLCEHQLLICD